MVRRFIRGRRLASLALGAALLADALLLRSNRLLASVKRALAGGSQVRIAVRRDQTLALGALAVEVALRFHRDGRLRRLGGLGGFGRLGGRARRRRRRLALR